MQASGSDLRGRYSRARDSWTEAYSAYAQDRPHCQIW